MEPLKVAMVGCGRRGQSIYLPILKAFKDVVQVTAVCDPAAENATAGAEAFGVPKYTSLRDLVKDRPMEAALCPTPAVSHSAVSCLLSAGGVHNLIETPICPTLSQGRAMVHAAEQSGVVFRVAENFFRDPWDLLARKLIDADVIGAVGRITNYHAHLGYHNNSRHQVFAGSAPVAVNGVNHSMEIPEHVDNMHRRYGAEVFRSRLYHFPDGLLITDVGGDAKSTLGRYPRPGYHEIDGAVGAIIQQALEHWTGQGEVRVVPQERFANGVSPYSDSYPIVYLWEDHDGKAVETKTICKGGWGGWAKEMTFCGVKVELPDGEFRYEPEMRTLGIRNAYLQEVAGCIYDFARQVRGEADYPFTPEMAVMSLQMEYAADLSARREGVCVGIEDAGLEDLDAEMLAKQKEAWGVDPLDFEAMIDIGFPKA